MNTKTRIAFLAGLSVILVGCKSEKNSLAWEDPFFPADHITPASKVMFDRQVANGAAADGMLFDVHFDGGELNSLGTSKLTAMITGKPAHAPLKIFLNMPKDDGESTARQAAVEKALNSAGMNKEQFAVAFGPNPRVLMPADAGIRALAPAGAPAPVADTGAASVK